MAKTGSCKICYFHREVGSETGVACHRYPPTITDVDQQAYRITSHFPLVNNDAWCGEFEPILEKVADGQSRKTKRASSV